MRYIKPYENQTIREFLENESFREVDLSMLWKDYNTYRDQIIEKKMITFKDSKDINAWGKKGMIAEEFRDKAFKPLIEGKYIEWNMKKDKWGYSSYIGKVKSAFLHMKFHYELNFIFSASFYNVMGLPQSHVPDNTYGQDEYILLNIHDNKNEKIKIYNSELTELEEAINFLKDIKSYNL